MGSGAARSRQGPRHRHRRRARARRRRPSSVVSSPFIVDGRRQALVVAPPRPIRSPTFAHGSSIGRVIQAAPSAPHVARCGCVGGRSPIRLPRWRQDQPDHADRDERQRDDLRGRDAEERPVVRAQRLEREARDAVPDEEGEQQVAGSQPRSQPVPEEHEERRAEQPRDRLVQEERVEPRRRLGIDVAGIDGQAVGAVDRDAPRQRRSVGRTAPG